MSQPKSIEKKGQKFQTPARERAEDEENVRMLVVK
jgi:hypothetical protein